MRLTRFCSAALLGILLFVVGTVWADDTIKHRENGKDIPDSGEIISETPGSITISKGGKKITVDPVNVIDVVYDVKPELRQERNSADQLYDKARAGGKAEIKAAIAAYQALATKLVSDKKPAQLHVQYKIAILTAKLADDDKDQRKSAIDLVDGFTKAKPDGWQISSALSTLAKLYSEDNNFDKAVETLDRLKKVDGVGKEIKADCDAKVVEFLIKAKRHQEASKRIDTLLTSLKSDDPQAARLKMLQYVCKAQDPGQVAGVIKGLKDDILKTNDPAQIAMAYNTLGDCYMMNNSPADALWQYLFVDTRYFQDKTEHQKALTQLVEVYKRLNMPEKAKVTAERLEKYTR
jgi:tetratricopeptide (TPR) repeat protein